MANSTTNIDTLSSSQSQKEVTANALFDAFSPAALYGRRASTSSALTWGYYGGNLLVAGAVVSIANGVLTLAASTTNYVEANATTGAVTSNTSGFTAGRIKLYSIVTGSGTVTSYIDYRTAGAGSGSGTPTGPRVQTVTYAASVTLDCASYDIFDIGPLTGNIAITLANAVSGQKVEVSIKQDGTGSRTITWVNAIGYGTDLTAANSASDMTANKTDEYGFRYHAASTTYRMVACARGY